MPPSNATQFYLLFRFIVTYPYLSSFSQFLALLPRGYFSTFSVLYDHSEHLASLFDRNNRREARVAARACSAKIFLRNEASTENAERKERRSYARAKLFVLVLNPDKLHELVAGKIAIRSNGGSPRSSSRGEPLINLCLLCRSISCCLSVIFVFFLL